MSKINLFHYIGTLDIGGEQTYLASLINHLGKDYKHTVAYSFSDRLKNRIQQPVNYIKLSDKKLRASDPEIYLLFFRFLDIFKHNRPDAVILYSPGVPNFLCSLAAKILNIPVIYIPQRAYGNQSRWERIVTKFYPLRLISYGLIDRVIALGSYYQDDFIKNWKIPKEKVVLNYIGIDLNEFRPDEIKRRIFREQLSLTDDLLVFGFVGRLHPVKGFYKVLKFFQVLQQQINDTKLVLLVVGDGPFRETYQRLVDELSLKSIIFVGYRPDIDFVMNGIDVYIQATDNPLNGISSIEAIACGKTIITIVRNQQEIAMARDTTVEGLNGWFVRLDRLDHDVPKVLDIIDCKKREKMGFESRRIAEQIFDINNHVQNISNMLNSLIGKSGGVK